MKILTVLCNSIVITVNNSHEFYLIVFYLCKHEAIVEITNYYQNVEIIVTETP